LKDNFRESTDRIQATWNMREDHKTGTMGEERS
jgi:hypothetical protein